jgi:hypothetical protein
MGPVIQSPDVQPVNAEEMPLPMGVWEQSGQLLPDMDARALDNIDEPEQEVMLRGAEADSRFLAIADVDPNNLSEAGWGIIFPSKVDPAIREALQPLIDHRSLQVREPSLLKVFEGASGFQTGDTVRSWLSRFNVGFSIVDPALGVPLYLLIVASPEEIPFEFQYLLDTYWSVGRLHFDTPEEYRAYVQGVISYETAPTVAQKRVVGFFNTMNPGDRPTGLLHNLVAKALVDGSGPTKPLGQRQGFKLVPLLAEDATRHNLRALFQGTLTGGLPPLLFTGSHGLAVEDENSQRARQGAIVCQNWEGGPVSPEMTFAASDLPENSLQGLIHFFFACYGGGCPKLDNYRMGTDGKPVKIANETFVAKLPQAMLRAGALAVLAHIDRAWSYSFMAGRSASQVQEFRDVMVRILKGERIGQASDQFNLRWAVLSAELSDAMREKTLFPEQVSDLILANRWVARNDARNYIILGDPAVKLRVDAMTD